MGFDPIKMQIRHEADSLIESSTACSMSQISVASHPSQITRVNVHNIRSSEPSDYRLPSVSGFSLIEVTDLLSIVGEIQTWQ